MVADKDGEEQLLEEGQKEPKEKAQLDTEELKESEGRPGGDKVELDLEDAPFLAEEEEAPPPAIEVAPREAEGEGPKSKFALLIEKIKQNKKLAIGVGAGLLLVIAAAVYFLLPMLTGAKPEEAPKEEAKVEKGPAVPEKKEFVVSWDQFWVEQKDDDGQIRFLICKFSAPTENEQLAWEIQGKKLLIRDAIFYYLRNKNLTFLADKGNSDALKKDLLGVVNQYLSSDQLGDLFVEEYLVK